MFFTVDPASELAIYDQIVRQVKFAVAHGTLKTGELVPSVRELARELAINPNTVARAYQQLQAEGVLEMVRGTGLAVAAGAARGCRADRLKLVQSRLQETLTEARRSGLDDAELRSLVESVLKSVLGEKLDKRS